MGRSSDRIPEQVNFTNVGIWKTGLGGRARILVPIGPRDYLLGKEPHADSREAPHGGKESEVKDLWGWRTTPRPCLGPTTDSLLLGPAELSGHLAQPVLTAPDVNFS